jgi:hypothetical protein
VNSSDYTFNFSDSDWQTIAKNVSVATNKIFQYDFRTKLKSEIVSSLFVSESEKHFLSNGIKVRKDSHDHQPDLYFYDNEHSVEIKVTKNQKSIKWMGGKYSKRPAQYVLVVWEELTRTVYGQSGISFYISTCNLKEDDWKSIDNGKENYYATVFTFAELIKKCPKNLVGTEHVFENFYYDTI